MAVPDAVSGWICKFPDSVCTDTRSDAIFENLEEVRTLKISNKAMIFPAVFLRIKIRILDPD